MPFYQTAREIGRSSLHTAKLAETLNKQREEQPDLCDLSIQTQGKVIKAHWCVVVSCPYFESMYHSGLVEKTSGLVNILVGKRYAVEALIQYLYIGRCEISMDNIEDILEVADYLQCLDVRQLCDDFLSCYPLDQNSCVKICLLSSMYDLSVGKKAMQYLKGHLPDIMKGDDMLSFNEESVLSLITDEELRYVSQGAFLEFIKRWLKHDLNNRMEYTVKLFESINYVDIGKGDLEDLMNDDKLVDLIPKKKLKELVENKKTKSEIVLEPNKEREVILLGGGSHRHRDRDSLYSFFSQWLYVYDFKDGHWSKLWNTPRIECQRQIVKKNNSTLYVIGTEPVVDFYNSSDRYTLYTLDLDYMHQWGYIKLYLENFDLHDLILCGSDIYLLGVGGANNRPYQQACKIIQVNDNGVQDCRELFDCSSKDGFYGFAMDENRITLVCELFNEKTYSIKYYDLKDKVLSTPNRAKSCSSTVSYTKIMIEEGQIIQLDLKKRIIRKFNPKENTWYCYPKISRSPEELTNTAMYSFWKDQLYMLGGERSSKCYRYDCCSKLWMEIESLPIGDSVLYSCVTSITTVPAKFLTCHPNCPHCLYQSKWEPIIDPSDSECEEDKDSYRYDDTDDWDDDERSSRSECSIM